MIALASCVSSGVLQLLAFKASSPTEMHVAARKSVNGGRERQPKILKGVGTGEGTLPPPSGAIKL